LEALSATRGLVTGFRMDEVEASISVDRIWDYGRYCEQDFMPLWWPCNCTEAKAPFFKANPAFVAYKTWFELVG
jgi:hypothetical protein